MNELKGINSFKEQFENMRETFPNIFTNNYKEVNEMEHTQNLLNEHEFPMQEAPEIHERDNSIIDHQMMDDCFNFSVDDVFDTTFF